MFFGNKHHAQEINMQHTKNKGIILCFEDDQDVSDMLVDYLTEQDYQVILYTEFPEQGVESIKEKLTVQPEIVLMDIGMPVLNGYEICKKLKQGFLDQDIPVVFISGKISEQDILRAYDSGASDYLTKPLKLKELGVKLQQYSDSKSARKRQREHTSDAQKLAFDAMTASSKLGEILRFHEKSYLTKNLDELAILLLETIKMFSLKSSILFFTDTNSFYRDDGQQKPLEEKILLAFKDQQRVFSWKKRTFFNYDYFSVLIRDMPIDDQERYGVLKDQLCLLFNGVDARVKALTIEKSNELKAITMKIAADTIANMVMEIENDNVELSQHFENIILKLEANVQTDIIQFNLLENEEKILLAHIMVAIKESSAIFETSLEKERQYKDIMNRLLKELLSSS